MYFVSRHPPQYHLEGGRSSAARSAGGGAHTHLAYQSCDLRPQSGIAGRPRLPAVAGPRSECQANRVGRGRRCIPGCRDERYCVLAAEGWASHHRGPHTLQHGPIGIGRNHSGVTVGLGARHRLHRTKLRRPLRYCECPLHLIDHSKPPFRFRPFSSSLSETKRNFLQANQGQEEESHGTF